MYVPSSPTFTIIFLSTTTSCPTYDDGTDEQGVNADTGQVLFSGTHLKSWKAGKESTPSPITKTLAKL